MIEAGTPIVGGVALGRGGTDMDGLPLYDRIAELPQKPNIALIYTPAEGVRDAVTECARRASRPSWRWPNMCRCTTPRRRRMSRARPEAGSSGRTRSASLCRAADCSARSRRAFCKPGRLALIVRSGTVTLALARQLTLAGIGQRIVAHVGGDTVIGRNPDEYLRALATTMRPAPCCSAARSVATRNMPSRRRHAAFRSRWIAMVIGRHAPAEKQMGHAGALVGSAREGADAKLAALADAGCRIAKGRRKRWRC